MRLSPLSRDSEGTCEVATCRQAVSRPKPAISDRTSYLAIDLATHVISVGQSDMQVHRTQCSFKELDWSKLLNLIIAPVLLRCVRWENGEAKCPGGSLCSRAESSPERWTSSMPASSGGSRRG